MVAGQVRWPGLALLRLGIRSSRTQSRSAGNAFVDILATINDQDSYRATRATPRRVLASQASAGTGPALRPLPGALAVSASLAVTMFSVAHSGAGFGYRPTTWNAETGYDSGCPRPVDWVCATPTAGQQRTSAPPVSKRYRCLLGQELAGKDSDRVARRLRRSSPTSTVAGAQCERAGLLDVTFERNGVPVPINRGPAELSSPRMTTPGGGHPRFQRIVPGDGLSHGVG